MCLWRAVDKEGEVPDMPVQRRRCKSAALRLLRKLMKRQGFASRTIVIDRLRSFGAALRELGFAGRHEQGLRANIRAETSHQPIRRRERKMQRFKSPKSAQRFLFAPATVYNMFNFQRQRVLRSIPRQVRADAANAWNDVTATV